MATSDEILGRQKRLEQVPDRSDAAKIEKARVMATLEIAFQLALFNERTDIQVRVPPPETTH